MHDILIKNGLVVDGTGMPAFEGDVAIRDGRIAERGRVSGAAGIVIDAQGLVVAPGFIDMHTHYDCQLLWDPLATSSCWHGVTTVVTGNCGFTIAPGGPSDAEYLMRLMARVEAMEIDVLRAGIEWDWESFGSYVERLERALGLNVAPLVGHSALRYHVMGPESYERPSKPEELARMKSLLQEAMASGAAGFSTDQSKNHVGGYGEPVPSRMGAWDEMVELSSVVGEAGFGVIGVSPYPGGGDIPEEFRRVMLRTAEASRRPVIWNSLVHRWDQPDLYRRLMTFMEEANKTGRRIYAMGRTQRMDLEFNLRFTAMFDLFPAWREAVWAPDDEKRRLFRDPGTRARLREEWDTRVSRMSSRRPELLEVTRASTEGGRRLEGRRLMDLAADRGQHLVDVMLDVALEENLDVEFTYVGTMNGDPSAVAEIVSCPHAIPGTSDAGAHVEMECGVDFSDVLLGTWVRDQGVMGLEEAIARLTSSPAALLGLQDRGLLKEGMAADVVLFDAESIGPTERQRVSDLPGGGRRLVRRCDAVKAVIVNGQMLLRDGRHTGTLPGRVVGRKTS